MKRENELLTVIMEELDDLVKMGYNGSFLSEETSGLTSSLQEYKLWKNKLGV